MFVRPRPGVRVRDPNTKRHLPEAGAEVPESTYWVRRVRDGDVIVDESPRPIDPPRRRGGQRQHRSGHAEASETVPTL